MAETPVVAIAGSGPAVEAVEAALADADARVERFDGTPPSSAVLAVVVAPCGARAFDQVHRTVECPWIAVELGGVGGLPMAEVDAAVSVLDPDGGCFDCLRTRVHSNAKADGTVEPRTTRSDARLAGAIAGRLVVSALDGDDVVGRVVELPYVERRFLPVPGCACEGDSSAATELDRSYDDVPVEEAAARAEVAVDDRLGLVREIGEAHSFPAPYYLATLCDTTAFSDAEAGPMAAGVDVDWNAAFVKAVGEALERYGAGVYRESSFEVAATNDLQDAVAPSSFVLSPDFEEPDPSEPIPWRRGESLHTGESVHLPAEFVVFPPLVHRHAPSITTGLGLGSSVVGALLSGLYEVVERDATMLSWYSTFEPLGLSVEDETFEALARRARSEDLAVTSLLVTQDVDVPVVTVAVHREDGWPRFAVGSGANLDPVAAASGALAEALQNWMELRAMGPERAAEDDSAIARYAELPPDARSLLDVETTVPASHLGSGDGSDAPTGAEALDALLGALEAAGLSAYAARLTPRDVERVGFEVVRVLVPGAQPLFTGDRFFGERARTVPRTLGFRPRLDRPPHPYP